MGLLGGTTRSERTYMNCLHITKLLLQPELWEPTGRSFDDELRLKDRTLRFFSDQAVRFREEGGNRILYEVPFIAWLWILPLAKRLRRRVTPNAKLTGPRKGQRSEDERD